MGSADAMETITDLHTESINRLKALYVPSTTFGPNLESIGYTGYIDPYYDETVTDFVAIGDSGDVQQFRLIGMSESADSIEEDISKFAQKDIPLSDVQSFLECQNVAITPNSQQKVALLPQDLYQSYEAKLDSLLSENQLIGWVVDISENSEIRLAMGDHSQDALNEQLDPDEQGPILLRDVNCDFCSVSRASAQEVRLFRFAERLISYCYNRQKESVSLHAIDDIMVVNGNSNVLGHLSEKERKEIWNRCMWHMSHSFNLMRKSSDSLHQYEWKRPRFLSYAGDRSKILDVVREELGVGEEA